jgi:hypothetical protein
VTPSERRAFYGVAQQLITEMDMDQDFVYVALVIRERVKMRNWTKSGLLRNLAFHEVFYTINYLEVGLYQVHLDKVL